MKIVIVGGGCAGLTAAHNLISAGYDDITILEQKPKAGGRMTAYHGNGYHLDMAAQLIHPGYHAARALIHELGMDDEVVNTNLGSSRFFNGKDRICMKPIGDPVEDEKNAAWMAEMGVENFQRFVCFVQDRCKEKMYEGSVDWFLDLDDKGNFRDFVVENFGEGLLHNFVEPILAGIALAHPEEIGIGFGLQILWTVLAGDASILKRGLGSLAETIIGKYSDKIRTNVTVEEIVIEDGKAVGVKTKDDGFFPADVVICAITANRALKVLPDLPEVMREALSKVTYCPAITAALFLDNEKVNFVKSGLFFRRSLDAPFGAMSFRGLRSPQSVPEGKDCITTFVYREACERLWDQDDAVVVEEILKSMELAFPGVKEAVWGYHLQRFPEANYLMEPGCSSAIKDLRENHYQDVKGLYLCGEYMYTGSYESAIAAGSRAAQVIMGNLEHI